MSYKVSNIPCPHYIQVIHDELFNLVEQSNREQSISKLRMIRKRIDYLSYTKKRILKAMRKHYDKTTFEETFYNFYYVDE